MEGGLMKEVSDCDTLVEMWLILDNFFVAHSEANIFQYKSKMSNLCKGTMTITDYFMRMTDIVMQPSMCGYIVLEKDRMHSMLNGVDRDYDLVHAKISSKIEPMIVREVQSMLLTHEKRLKKHNTFSVDNLLTLIILA